MRRAFTPPPCPTSTSRRGLGPQARDPNGTYDPTVAAADEARRSTRSDRPVSVDTPNRFIARLTYRPRPTRHDGITRSEVTVRDDAAATAATPAASTVA